MNPLQNSQDTTSNDRTVIDKTQNPKEEDLAPDLSSAQADGGSSSVTEDVTPAEQASESFAASSSADPSIPTNNTLIESTPNPTSDSLVHKVDEPEDMVSSLLRQSLDVDPTIPGYKPEDHPMDGTPPLEDSMYIDSPNGPAPITPISPTPDQNRPPNYKLRYTMSGHTLSISSLKFSRDGSMLASCGMSPYLALYSRHLLRLSQAKLLTNWSRYGMLTPVR